MRGVVAWVVKIERLVDDSTTSTQYVVHTGLLVFTIQTTTTTYVKVLVTTNHSYPLLGPFSTHHQSLLQLPSYILLCPFFTATTKLYVIMMLSLFTYKYNEGMVHLLYSLYEATDIPVYFFGLFYCNNAFAIVEGGGGNHVGLYR